jgi:hypothetical protein
MELAQLYTIAGRNQIPVLRHPLPLSGSLALQADQGCVIGLDRTVCDCRSVEKTHLAHELGHCLTGSFYNQYSSHDLRRRHEIRADKWAIRQLVPAHKLDEAIADGRTEIWELAEYFNVTEDFMRKAVAYHVHGNLATELYF